MAVFQSVAQMTGTGSQPEVFYSSPKTYVIGGVEVQGLGEQYDPATLIQLASLHKNWSTELKREFSTEES